MAYEFILTERQGDVGIITLNRPERMNAMTYQMSFEYTEAVAQLNEDPDVAAIVITGAGRAFCSGVDVSRFEDSIRTADGHGDQNEVRPRQPRNWIETARGGKPIVVAVNGACIGAGLTRILPCDVRIASTRALFSMRFVKVGIVPEIASTQILPQIVGLQNALDLCVSARTIDAQEALRIGLVMRVVEPEDLLPAALQLAGDYAENGVETMIEAKRLIYANYVESDITRVSQREREALARRRGSEEQREAVAAFRAKRTPDFRSLRTQA